MSNLSKRTTALTHVWIAAILYFTGCVNAASVKVAIDVRKQAQQVLGFGVNIWPGDTKVEPCFDRLSMKWARLWLGGGGEKDAIAAGQPLAYYQSYWDKFFDAHPISISSAKTSVDMANRHGVALLNLLGGGVPKTWVEARYGYKFLIKGDDYTTGFGRYVAAGIAGFASRGVPTPYLDITNEPDCGTIISPVQYAAILKECRASLDQQGLMPDKVKIAGPGIAHIDFDAKGDPYVNALDSNAVADLGAWANHAYIWNNKLFDSPSGSQAMATAAHLEEASFRSKDPNAKLPWIESEYGASTPDYHGITFADDTAKRAALPYAAREMADTLAFFENGVNALIYWQGKDQYWDKGKWGLLDEKGQPKPVFDALSTLLPKLAENKYRVVTVSPDPTGFTGAAFVDKARLIVALANPTAAQIDATLSITGAKRLRFSDSATFTSGALGSTVLQPDAKGDYHVSLPSDSTITIEFSHR